MLERTRGKQLNCLQVRTSGACLFRYSRISAELLHTLWGGSIQLLCDASNTFKWPKVLGMEDSKLCETFSLDRLFSFPIPLGRVFKQLKETSKIFKLGSRQISSGRETSLFSRSKQTSRWKRRAIDGGIEVRLLKLKFKCFK